MKKTLTPQIFGAALRGECRFCGGGGVLLWCFITPLRAIKALLLRVTCQDINQYLWVS